MQWKRETDPRQAAPHESLTGARIGLSWLAIAESEMVILTADNATRV